MIPRKRLTLQLTPLLDLLLIVMFSQHLEYRHLANSQKQTLQNQQQQLTKQRDALSRQYLDVAQTLSQFLSPEQNDQLGRQLSDFPEVRKALTNRLNSAPDAPLRFVNHVFGMQNRVTIWEIHLLGNDRATIYSADLPPASNPANSPQVPAATAAANPAPANPDAATTPIDRNSIAFSSPEDFATQLFSACKRLPTPKSLVLLLLSWDDASFGNRLNAENGLSILVNKLKEDANGERWYDSFTLGERPKLISPPPTPR
jgi:hypothetical protein